MKDDYKLVGPTGKLDVQIEKPVLDTLTQMSAYSKLELSELVNTAVKRFIAAHKDFLPPKKKAN